MNRSTLVCFVFLFIVGGITFSVKQQVLQLESKIITAKKEITQYEEALHILSAEWSYLNNPERLQVLVERNLELVPGDHLQFVSLDNVGNESDLALPTSQIVHLTSAH
jgi:cell division protein FtsL